MKNSMKKMLLLLCVMLMLQSVAMLNSMQRMRQFYETAKSKLSDKWQILKEDLDKLQDAMGCINTNSCDSKQQAYIKALMKKVGVAVAAAMTACGIYSVVRSKQYVGLKEQSEAGSNIAKGFSVQAPENIILVEDFQRFLDALRLKDDTVTQLRYDQLALQIGNTEDEDTLKALQNQLQRYKNQPGYQNNEKITTLLTTIKAALYKLKHSKNLSHQAE